MKKYFLLLFILFMQETNALILEDLAATNILYQTLAGKRIGFYIGSFDPLHLGHQETAQLLLQKKLCDYVLIYPAWGGDQYKKRALIADRLEMLFAVFADDPHIIVTRLGPAALQQLLTHPDDTRQVNDKPTVKPAFINTQFIGVIGSDVALSLSKNEEALLPFMQGLVVPEKYEAHTIGGIISLPVAEFIISQRAGDDVTTLNSKLGNRPIITIINSEATDSHSSTTVKKALQRGQPLNRLLSPNVEKIIQEKRLYMPRD